MPTQHKVKKGETLLSIARHYGLLPETVWNDPSNAELRRKRKDPDVVQAGDVVVVRGRMLKEESGSTEQKHLFKRKAGLGLVIRLDMDPGQAPNRGERFVLASADGSYRAEKTVKDDLVPGDRYLDLHYSGLHKQKSYTLQVIAAEGDTPETIFENVPYGELAGLSGVSGSGTEQAVGQSTEEDAPYPEEPDEERAPPG